MICPIVELRRYALQPGAREALIDLFDREFVETQEDVGMSVLGQFRDLDDPDSFVWLRGFSDMETRRRALDAFYSGSVWKRHGPAANATMLDTDNVLLLRAVSGLPHRAAERPPRGGSQHEQGILVVTVYPLKAATASDFPDFFLRQIEPALCDAGLAVLGTYATEHAENTYPALPMREGEEVFVWMTMVPDESERARRASRLEQAASWRGGVVGRLAEYSDGPADVLRLEPTGRSAIHA